MIYGENIREKVYVTFHQEDGPGLVYKFPISTMSDLDPVTDELIIKPYNGEGKKIVTDELRLKGHADTERCAVWRYLFFTRPGGRSVRYARVKYPAELLDRFGLIEIKSIEEHGI